MANDPTDVTSCDDDESELIFCAGAARTIDTNLASTIDAIDDEILIVLQRRDAQGRRRNK
jgi:hypothetical protein